MERFNIEKNKILFDDKIKCLNFDIKTPLLINKDNKCLLGNSLRDFRNDIVDVILVDIECEFEKNALIDFENELVDNLPEIKKYEIEKEINKYLIQFENQFEKISLFDDFELFENRTITEQNYNKPNEYNFKKGKKKEVIVYESLFSLDGDEF